ncbi:MAG TPA: glutamate-1-semialdehyde 2,1-aminomutase [Polyangiaceae bacterium]|jgi:glutamate-1-semialdehyde 2,1-aminomutase|nr:glutamate-1-semialdehyde 2,1-aminomutase [Polyangiaceae bacterium]
MKFDKSLALQPRFNAIIPGGSHTYAKGDDQFPEFMPAYIVRGKGSHVWDADGNEFIEYGSGLRAVTLGHGYQSVCDAAYAQMQLGTNFIRPATIELEVAEQLLSLIKGAEMVKFTKNGSDANDGALKLARAYTGRDLVAICGDHPFFSVNDWFMGSTAMNAGIPEGTRQMTVKFRYNDIASLEQLFAQHPGKIAAVFLEPEKDKPPVNDFLHEVQKLCKKNGTVFILDEMITGFRWHLNGAQAMYEVVPDLSCFGKALGNGFAISAVVGKREIMQLGGLYHDKERVFLGSTTHGAETHALAAAREVMNIYQREPVIKTLWERGERLAAGIKKAAIDQGVDEQIATFGKPCCLVYGTKDQDKQPSQGFRTLFIQESMKRGVLGSSLVVSYSHTEQDIDRTIEAFHGAMGVYKKALDEGLEKYLVGRPVKPVMRARN